MSEKEDAAVDEVAVRFVVAVKFECSDEVDESDRKHLSEEGGKLL